jgi:hypothetical protein
MTYRSEYDSATHSTSVQRSSKVLTGAAVACGVRLQS